MEVSEKIQNVANNLTVSKPDIQQIENFKKVSAFSLSSIKAKKELLQEQQKSTVHQETKKPTDDFDFQTLNLFWKQYAANLGSRGMKIAESLLLMNEPTLDGNIMFYEVPNQGARLDFELEKTLLLRFLHSNLNNYEIDIQVVVNEKMEQKVAFTPQDKYERLLRINPKLELLKRTFDLDY